MIIKELERYDQSQFYDLHRLISELTDKVELTQMSLMMVLRDKNSHLYVIQEGDHIIGCATLCVYESPTGTKASIEDVVVSSAYRGHHLGRQLLEKVLQEAWKLAPIELHLTSKPNRIAAIIWKNTNITFFLPIVCALLARTLTISMVL